MNSRVTRSRERVLLLAAAATGLGLAGSGLRYGAREFLHRQADAARRVVGKPLGEVAPDADGRYKKTYGDPLELLLLGDSIAAGLGADLPKETLGGRLAKRLAKATRRTVHLTTAARVGSESSMLADQLAGLSPSYRPDVAVIVVGGNDVTHRVPVSESVRHLEETIVALRERGAVVVVGTCPDLGALRPVPQPLRALGSRASSRTPTRCSASTASTPARSATSARPRRCCPRCSRRWAWSRRSRSGTALRRPRRPDRRYSGGPAGCVPPSLAG